MRGILLAFLLLAGPAFAQIGGQQYGPSPCPVGASGCQVKAADGTTPLSLANWFWGIGKSDNATTFAAYDGSTQLATGDSALATEYWQADGAPAGFGPALYANGSGTNVTGTLAAKGTGGFAFGNASGTIFELIDPGAVPANWWKFTSVATGVGLILTAKGSDTNINAGVAPKALGAFIVGPDADSTTTGGNARGSNAIDLCSLAGHSAANQVPSGANSACLWGANNLSSAASAASGGTGHITDGTFSTFLGGSSGRAWGRYGFWGISEGVIASNGDSQAGITIFRGRSTGGAAVLLVANGSGSANNTSPNRNCLNMSVGEAIAMRLMLTAKNATTSAHQAAWHNTALLSRDTSGVATTVLALGTATTLGTDTITVSATADTTNGCLNFSVTPPNTDTWNFALRVDLQETFQ